MKSFDEFINESREIDNLKRKIGEKESQVKGLYNPKKLTPEYEKSFSELHDLKMELDQLLKDESKGIRPTK
jgi:hypothetical protein